MKSKEFVERAKYIESQPTKYYSVAGGDWARWNGSSYNFDCVILIKAILWGWNGSKVHPHGGCSYGSNGVYDDTADSMFNRCLNKSNDFSKIKPGEVVYLDGHIGIYVGDRHVIEATAAWEGKVVISELGQNGERVRNGRQVYTWLQHGELPYIDYSDYEDPKPVEPAKPEVKSEFKVGDKVEVINPVIYGTNNKFAKYYDLYDVIEVKGDRVVIGIGNTITAPIHAVNIKKAGSKDEPLKPGDIVYPIQMVDYKGTPLVSYDKEYEITCIDGRGAVLSAVRGNERPTWAVVKVDNLKRI